jgi:Fe2+ or Zn2+ uptake regulation protein
VAERPGDRGEPDRAAAGGEPVGSGTGGDPVAEAIALLRARGDRVTASRRAVIEELEAATVHLTADDLLERVRGRADGAEGVHLATVYRTLEALTRSGVVAHIHLPHGATTYHLVRPGHRLHLHLVCRNCDRLFDVAPETLDGVAADLDRSHGFRLDSEHVALTGWCRDCRPG